MWIISIDSVDSEGMMNTGKLLLSYSLKIMPPLIVEDENGVTIGATDLAIFKFPELRKLKKVVLIENYSFKSTCIVCGELFSSSRVRRKYCSSTCHKKNKNSTAMAWYYAHKNKHEIPARTRGTDGQFKSSTVDTNISSRRTND